ncbi:hypothetical protein H9P43_005941 [Blastocladiella emersonii ATCC 22665]|nr:hypothetical protein H9P43_005941 [Blastocladiella emersonii ATCC 22665]
MQQVPLPQLPVDLVEDILLLAAAATCREHGLTSAPCPCKQLLRAWTNEPFVLSRDCPNGDRHDAAVQLRAYLKVTHGLGRLREFVLDRLPGMQLFHVYADDRADRLRALRARCGRERVKQRLAEMRPCVHCDKHEDEVGLPVAAFRHGHMQVLGELFAFPPHRLVGELHVVLEEATRGSRIDVLELWHRVAHPSLRGNLERFLTLASNENRTTTALDWWYGVVAAERAQATAPLPPLRLHLDQASEAGFVETLKWWTARVPAVEITYSKWALDRAWSKGRVEVLEWWLASGLELKYTEAAFLTNTDNQYDMVKMLDLWRQSGQPILYTDKACKSARPFEIAAWWDQFNS